MPRAINLSIIENREKEKYTNKLKKRMYIYPVPDCVRIIAHTEKKLDN